MLLRLALLVAAWLAVAGPAASLETRTVRWARASDALTLDPHAQNEGTTHTLNHHIYEPLIIRDSIGRPLPALAESWSITSDPTVWEFRLRKGVKFHDGTPFTADDVVFSLQRASQPESDMRALLASVETVTRVDDSTVRIKTKGPNPLLPANLTDLFIMSKAWAERYQVVKVQDFKANADSYAAKNANGTGPYILVSRERDVRTVLRRNDDYWGKGRVPLDVSDIEFVPIKADADRVSALLKGDVDFVQDVPVSEIQRLQASQKVRINIGAENRAIFLGFNIGAPELKSSNVRGANPFADKRVRQAVNMTVNRQAIQRAVMHGQSIPTGIIAPPGVNGYAKELDVIPPQDPAKAKALMKEAGYEAGFTVTLNCTNDRYVNDEAICQAIVGQLATIGINVTLVAQTKAVHFPLIQSMPPETDFYMLGWGVPTFDSEYIFANLFHTRTDVFGAWNGERYSNPEIDKLIEGLATNTDATQRNQAISQVWKVLQDEVVVVPIHIQTLAYAMQPDLDIPVDINNQPKLKFVKVGKK